MWVRVAREHTETLWFCRWFVVVVVVVLRIAFTAGACGCRRHPSTGAAAAGAGAGVTAATTAGATTGAAPITATICFKLCFKLCFGLCFGLGFGLETTTVLAYTIFRTENNIAPPQRGCRRLGIGWKKCLRRTVQGRTSRSISHRLTVTLFG